MCSSIAAQPVALDVAVPSVSMVTMSKWALHYKQLLRHPHPTRRTKSRTSLALARSTAFNPALSALVHHKSPERYCNKRVLPHLLHAWPQLNILSHIKHQHLFLASPSFLCNLYLYQTSVNILHSNLTLVSLIHYNYMKVKSNHRCQIINKIQQG
jgi:hypothetical protein